jgi:N-acetylmuramic acid 6-phosphate (MurNAc-6-P) etherase
MYGGTPMGTEVLVSNQELATRLAEISSLSEEDALAALQAGGRPRELALSILESQKEFEKQQQQLAAAKEKLRELTPA